MKKIFVCFISVLFIINLLVFSAFATSLSADVDMKPVNGSYAKGSKFNTHFYVKDIESEVGLILAEFHVVFDSDNLKITNFVPSNPKGWDFTNDTAEAWMYMLDDSDNVFVFSLLNALPGTGIKEDDEMYIDIEFEVLNDIDSTVIRLESIEFMDDKLDEFTADNKTFLINLNGSKDESQTENNDNPVNESANQESIDVSNKIDSESSDGDNVNNTIKIVVICVILAIVIAAAIIIYIIIIRKNKK